MFAAPAIAIAGMAATAAGTAVGAMGQIYSGEARANMANYQAGVADMNAKIAQQDASWSIASGEVEAQEAGLRTGEQVAQTKAVYAAGNIAANKGTAAQVVGSELAIGQQNQGILRANAAKRAYGYQVEAAEDTAQAGIYRSEARYDRTAANISAVSTILGGVGQVSSQFIAGRTSGVFNG